MTAGSSGSGTMAMSLTGDATRLTALVLALLFTGIGLWWWSRAATAAQLNGPDDPDVAEATATPPSPVHAHDLACQGAMGAGMAVMLFAML